MGRGGRGKGGRGRGKWLDEGIVLLQTLRQVIPRSDTEYNGTTNIQVSVFASPYGRHYRCYNLA